MRAVLQLQVIASVATLLVACNSTTGPELPPPTDSGISVLTVAPSLATIGGERFVKLTVLASAGDARDVPLSQVIWSSSDTNVATVRQGGLVEGRRAGRVQIGATWQTAHGSATVIVLNQVGKKPDAPGGPKCLKRAAWHLSIPPDGGTC